MIENNVILDNEFILNDRIQKIKQIIEQYGEDNFFLSFSGGLDSTVLSALLDMAIPGNSIPRVFANTGIEYDLIVQFVEFLSFTDDRFIVIKPENSIVPMLKELGYPFKSKEHSAVVESYQNGNKTGKWVSGYLQKTNRYACPDVLRYQFTSENNLKISDKCCFNLKEYPLRKWQKENNKPFSIVGVMRSENGRRSKAQCLSFRGGKLKSFQPLAPVSKKWEMWFISKYHIDICKIYKPPYNFKRTGCKGCPFNPYLKKTLDVMAEFFPNERKQCEIIWKPVYDEYRRIGYRLGN